jgi:predicted phosphodiesterase
MFYLHFTDRYLSYEDPDLIVLTGDQLTANNVDANATAYYDLLARKLTSFGVPWAMIFGNHDDAPLEKMNAEGSYDRYPAKTSRVQLAANDRRYFYSLTKIGDTNLFATSNYWIDIHFKDRVAARVLMLDSGGGTLEEEIAQNQIDWFWLHQVDYPDVPIVAFQHIPSTANDFGYDSNTCIGTNADDGVAPLSQDAGIVAALAAAGNVHVLGVGHNHGNDYCCKNTDTLHLCFGRHSGYGGYSRVERGSRVYRLNLDADGNYIRFSSYVRLETGDIINKYDP